MEVEQSLMEKKSFHVTVFQHPMMSFEDRFELENVFQGQDDQFIQKILGFHKTRTPLRFLLKNELLLFRKIYLYFMKNGLEFYPVVNTYWYDPYRLVHQENQKYIDICSFYSFLM